jgi:hypothetical protein
LITYLESSEENVMHFLNSGLATWPFTHDGSGSLLGEISHQGLVDVPEMEAYGPEPKQDQEEADEVDTEGDETSSLAEKVAELFCCRDAMSLQVID